MIIKFCAIVCSALIVSACGKSSSGGSFNNVGSSTINPTEVTASKKVFKLDYLSNGCLGDNNADAVTDYLFSNSKHKMLTWHCATGVKGYDGNARLDLFIKYDPVLACYKKVEGDYNNVLYGLPYSDVSSVNCTTPATPIAQPKLSGEITSFDVTVKYAEWKPNDFRYVVTLHGSWKNTGNIPIAQYREVILMEQVDEPQGAGTEDRTESFSEDNILLPGQAIGGQIVDISELRMVPGAVFKYTLVIEDYHGEVIDSVSKQITIE